MVASDMALCNIPGLVAACFPWRSAASAEARNFWVPDESCLVCYDCGSTFTFFNRRHHCRNCGQIFCRKCASDWIPAPSSGWNDLEERDMIRVCKQCFEQSQRRLTRRASVETVVDVGEQSGSISESILNWFLPNREKFVATSSLYAAGMNSEDSSKKKSKNNDDIKPLDIQNFALLWLPPDEANSEDNTTI